MQSKKQLFNFAPTIRGIIIFYCIIFFDLGLVLAKNRKSQNIIVAEISNHISNFAITSLMVALLAFIMTLQGAPFKFVIWLGIITVLMNFIVEVLISILNTPDIIDAFYGSAGAVLTVLAMYAFFKIGINTAAESKQ
jgi:hypothetical protein